MKCTTSGKTMFPHKRDAQGFINTRKDATLRCYQCPCCNAWHVTKLFKEFEPVPRELLNNPIKHTNDFKKYLDND